MEVGVELFEIASSEEVSEEVGGALLAALMTVAILSSSDRYHPAMAGRD